MQLVFVLLAGCSVTVTYTPTVNTDGTLGETGWGMTQDEVRDALGKRTATAETENMTKVPKAKLWGLPVTVEFVVSPYEGAGVQALRMDRIYITLSDSFDRAALTDRLNTQLGELVSGVETVLVVDGGNTLLAQGYVLCV